jgi:hypothetical protein
MVTHVDAASRCGVDVGARGGRPDAAADTDDAKPGTATGVDGASTTPPVALDGAGIGMPVLTGVAGMGAVRDGSRWLGGYADAMSEWMSTGRMRCCSSASHSNADNTSSSERNTS